MDFQRFAALLQKLGKLAESAHDFAARIVAATLASIDEGKQPDFEEWYSRTPSQLEQLQVIMGEYIVLIGLLKMMTEHSGAEFGPVRVSDLVSVSHSNIRLAPSRRTQAWTPWDRVENTKVSRRP